MPKQLKDVMGIDNATGVNWVLTDKGPLVECGELRLGLGKPLRDWGYDTAEHIRCQRNHATMVEIVNVVMSTDKAIPVRTKEKYISALQSINNTCVSAYKWDPARWMMMDDNIDMNEAAWYIPVFTADGQCYTLWGNTINILPCNPYKFEMPIEFVGDYIKNSMLYDRKDRFATIKLWLGTEYVDYKDGLNSVLERVKAIEPDTIESPEYIDTDWIYKNDILHLSPALHGIKTFPCSEGYMENGVRTYIARPQKVDASYGNLCVTSQGVGFVYIDNIGYLIVAEKTDSVDLEIKIAGTEGQAVYGISTGLILTQVTDDIQHVVRAFHMSCGDNRTQALLKAELAYEKLLKGGPYIEEEDMDGTEADQATVVDGTGVDVTYTLDDVVQEQLGDGSLVDTETDGEIRILDANHNVVFSRNVNEETVVRITEALSDEAGPMAPSLEDHRTLRELETPMTADEVVQQLRHLSARSSIGRIRIALDYLQQFEDWDD